MTKPLTRKKATLHVSIGLGDRQMHPRPDHRDGYWGNLLSR